MFQNTQDMKRCIFTFALACISMALFAQDSRLTTREEGHQGGVYRTSISSGEFYAKLISFTLANNEQVRFVADDVMTRMTRDQDFQKALESLRTYRFDNLIEALNVCASHGWEVRSTMVLEGRNGQEQHVLLARPIDTMMPVSPWLDRVPEDARSRQRQR